jgi:hypothetical protein
MEDYRQVFHLFRNKLEKKENNIEIKLAYTPSGSPQKIPQQKLGYFLWWRLPGSNWGHKALQASALPLS